MAPSSCQKAPQPPPLPAPRTGGLGAEAALAPDIKGVGGRKVVAGLQADAGLCLVGGIRPGGDDLACQRDRWERGGFGVCVSCLSSAKAHWQAGRPMSQLE